MRYVSWRNIAVTVPIVVFWLIVTAVLLKREVFVHRVPLPTSDLLAQQPDGIRPVDSWMGVYFSDGTKIGYTHTLVRPRPEPAGGGYRARNVTLISMSLLGHPAEIRAAMNWSLDAGGQVEDLEFTLNSSDSLFAAEGNVQGDKLLLKVSTGETEFTRELPISDNLFMSSTLSPLMTVPDIEEGVEYTVEMLDPVALTSRKATLKAGAMERLDLSGEKVDARRIEVDFSGFTSQVWVTEDGEIVKVETPVGLAMVKESPEQAVRGIATGEMLPDIASAAAVPAGKMIERPEDLDRMVVRFDGVDLESFPVWDSSQRIIDSGKRTVELNRAVPDIESVPDLPVSDIALAKFLEPSSFVQSDDPRIAEMAREIVGEEKNSWLAARLLAEWVDTEIENEVVASVPSAVDVLRTRQGDCNEHTVLYVALARAVGLPAKTDVGLVYKDGFFYYHAWPEVYVGKWVRIDPTFGQVIADATHIKLTEGELYRWTDILPTIRKLKLEIIEVHSAASG